MLPPPAKIFATCASVITYIMMLKTVFEATVPPPLQKFVVSYLRSRFGARLRSRSSILTLIIEDKDRSGTRNQFYDDRVEYIGTKVSGDGKKIRVTKERDGKNLSFSISEGEVLSDTFEGIKLDYKFCKCENSDPARINGQYRGDVLYKYLPYVESKAYQMRSENRVLMVYTNSSNFRWEETTLIHPSTFETMAMSINLLDDINLFIRRKEFYKKVGKAWKRGYGPPGTGKSSLVAAIANHLSFDIYDLQLTGVQDASWAWTRTLCNVSSQKSRDC